MQNQIGEYREYGLPSEFQRGRQPESSSVRTQGGVAADMEQRRGDYRRLIEANEKVLLRTALRLCRNHLEDAQDLVQETLVHGYEAFLDDRFVAGSNARAWLMRILMNLFLNTKRRHKWDSKVDLDSLIRDGVSHSAVLHAAPQDRPDTALWIAALDEPLEKALDTLTEELRTCLYLTDVEEFTYAEVAAMLAIPVGTVRSRLWRARRLLHAELLQYAQKHRRI